MSIELALITKRYTQRYPQRTQERYEAKTTQHTTHKQQHTNKKQNEASLPVDRMNTRLHLPSKRNSILVVLSSFLHIRAFSSTSVYSGNTFRAGITPLVLSQQRQHKFGIGSTSRAISTRGGSIKSHAESIAYTMDTTSKNRAGEKLARMRETMKKWGVHGE
jgi:hypothetical protein